MNLRFLSSSKILMVLKLKYSAYSALPFWKFSKIKFIFYFYFWAVRDQQLPLKPAVLYDYPKEQRTVGLLGNFFFKIYPKVKMYKWIITQKPFQIFPKKTFSLSILTDSSFQNYRYRINNFLYVLSFKIFVKDKFHVTRLKP